MQPLTAAPPYSLTLVPAAARHNGAERLAGRVALRAAVAREVGVDVRRVCVRRQPGAAPVVALQHPPADNCRGLVVSLSHRDGHAAAAASTRVAAIGVDLERLSAVDPAHTRYFLQPNERCLLQRYSASELWALKESAWKALGLGESVAFARLTLDTTRDLAVRGVILDGRLSAASAIVTHPSPDWVLAVLWIPGRAK